MITLLVILMFSLGLTFIVINYTKFGSENEPLIWGIIVCGILFVVGVITEIVGIVAVTNGVVIDNKIEICETENTNIENSVRVAVETYLQHENITYDKLSNANATTFVGVFPELSSNEIVIKQVEIINENNKRIRELKEEKANLGIWKFLIYFGH
jgi:hypothetical protein